MSSKQITPVQQFDGQLMGLRSRLATALEPAGMDVAYFLTMTGNYIRQNPALLECDRHSLMTAVVRSARCGLILDQATGHANILKFGREAVFAPGYPGLIHLAKKYANAADVRARAVYENDQFDFIMGYDEKITHRPWTTLGKKQSGRVIGYYAIIEYKDGFKRGEFIAVDEVNHIKASALRRSKGTGPWSDPYGEVRMGVKTAIIRLFKQIDKSPQLKLAVDAAEDSDAETPSLPEDETIPAAVVSKSSAIAASIKREDPEQPSAAPAADESPANAPAGDDTEEAGEVAPPESVPASEGPSYGFRLGAVLDEAGFTGKLGRAKAADLVGISAKDLAAILHDKAGPLSEVQTIKLEAAGVSTRTLQ